MIPDLAITPADRARIADHAGADFPREACGLLIGHRVRGKVRIDAVVPSANLAPEDSKDRFEVDPALYLREQRIAREQGKAVVGIYHSHPGGEAVPSAHDRAGAWIDDFVWIIVAPDREGRSPRWGAYWRGSDTEFLPMVISETEVCP